jgi:tripartite-type tricarboxylate transporter receptor subunit TctC
MMRAVPAIVLAVVTAILSSPAIAQDFPNRVVRIVVPYPPGGPNDLLARIVAQGLTDRWGRQVIVDNRPGGAATIGVALVARAAPDGYTMLIGSAGSMTIKASIVSKLPYDILKDFTPVTLLASGPFVMVVHPSVPARNVGEFIALARKRPGELLFGSPGNGSGGHLSGELLNLLGKVSMVHVPYKGGGPAMADLVSGQISVLFPDITTADPFVKVGKLRLLGVTSASRSRMLPGVPTIEEGGVPGYEVSTWYGLFAPAGTPKEPIARVSSDIDALMRTPALVSRLESLGADPTPLGPEPFAEFVRKDFAKWISVVKAANVKSD